MLRSEAIGIIQRGLGFRSDLEDEIVAALQEAQRLVELGRTLPRFLLQEDESFAVTSGSADIALPEGFIREEKGETFFYTDATTNNRVYLEKFTNLQRLRETLSTDDIEAGKPQAYYLRKATVAILPERDTSYTLTWSYYKKADLLDTDIENAWLEFAPDILIGKAGMSVAEAIGLSDAGMQVRHTSFANRYTTAWNAMLADDIMREEEADGIGGVGSRL